MGHSLIIKLWQAFVILIAFGAGYWQQMQQAPLVMVIATALSVLLAGLPLPLIASRPLVMSRLCHVKNARSHSTYGFVLIFSKIIYTYTSKVHISLHLS
jgi:hypothetical protein